MKPRRFIAIASVVRTNKLVALVTSNGYQVSNPNGVTTLDGLKFLHSLKQFKRNYKFVSYAFSRDNEFLFQSLPNDIKDRLFRSHVVRNGIEELEYENGHLADILDRSADENERTKARFELAINKTVLKDLQQVTHKGYTVSLANSRWLTIKYRSESVKIFDIIGFFRKPLYEVIKQWLGEDVPMLRREVMQQFRDRSEIDCLALAGIEASYVAKIAGKLHGELYEYGISLRNYHGAGAVGSWFLSSHKAKDEFYHYKHDKHIGHLARVASNAYYGGRVEQFKIGAVENVNVYDINSAYAYAVSLLPKMRQKPIPLKEWRDEIFSCWLCEYDFTSINPYFGMLPNREIANGSIKYKSKGKGYFWQPEVSFILKHYPECIDIKYGCYVPYERANFAEQIETLYDLRLYLQSINNPLEKVIKLALASIYGKFCQTAGRGYYYNLFYAGFVTSVVRARMLFATLGSESKTICFLTDAIHTTDVLADVSLSQNLGDYRLQKFAKGFYLDSGIYRLTREDGSHKEAHKGFTAFDFDKAIADLRERGIFEQIQQLFIGFNIWRLLPIQFSNYLGIYDINRATNPTDTALRIFEAGNFDITRKMIDSRISQAYSGRTSGGYTPTNNRDHDVMADILIAGKI